MGNVTACMSPYVIEEVSAGDPKAATQRIDAIRGLSLLDTNDDIESLADFLLLGVACQQKLVLTRCILPAPPTMA